MWHKKSHFGPHSTCLPLNVASVDISDSPHKTLALRNRSGGEARTGGLQDVVATKAEEDTSQWNCQLQL